MFIRFDRYSILTPTTCAVAIVGTLASCGGGGEANSEPDSPPAMGVTGGGNNGIVTFENPPCDPLPTASFIQNQITPANDLSDLLAGDFLDETSRRANQPWNYQVVSDLSRTENGNETMRFEIRTGDCGGDDCDSNPPVYRSVLSSPLNQFQGEERWYAFSVRKGEQFDLLDWTGSANARVIGFRLVDFDNLRGINENTGIDISLETGDLMFFHIIPNIRLGSLFMERPNIIERRLIATSAELGSSWNDVVVNRKISDDTDGFYRIYFNGQCVVNFNGPTLDLYSIDGIDGSDASTFEWGLRRPDLADLSGVFDLTTELRHVVYIDNVRSGNTYDEIVDSP